MKAFFYTFGCKVNQYETENIKEAMLSEGYEVTEDYADAEVCVVNTCTVTAQSDSKCRQLIHKIKKANPECLIVLAGCFPQAFEEEASALDECGIIVGTGAKKEIPALIKRYITSGERIIRIVPRERGEAFEKMTNSGADQKTRAYIKIQDGCDQYCTYCIIPTARGHICSKPLEDIAPEVQQLVDSGHKEIIFTGINLCCYGRDFKNGTRLIDAVEAACGCDGDYRVRIGSVEPLKKNSGRNSYGRITVRHRGGGVRRKYRVIDFKRNKLDMNATVLTIEYDPNRSAFIALVEYEDGEKRYIIAPYGLKVGDVIRAGADADIKPGNALAMINIPVGTFIHNIELYPGKGAQLVRSAGNMAQLMGKEDNYALVRLPSGEMRKVPVNCMATIGQVGNIDHENVNIGKAGRKRHMGWRPTVRGSVMNPCDHPHGGGEGRAPVGRPTPVTPWGKPTMGYKTRAKHHRSDKFIVKRRNGK